MSFFFKTITPFILSLAIIIAVLYAYSRVPVPHVEQSFGSFTPVGGQTYTLSGSGVIATATTIPLTSFTTPDGRALTMSMFGSIGYAVLDPNSPSRIEDITFTGITQNANGTAILTGVSRGMDFVSPYTASSTLSQAHAGGSYLILSNSAGFYGQQFLFSNNNSSSTAFVTFSPTAPPAYYPNVGQQAIGTYNSTTSEFASITYVNGVVAAGAANATAAVKGIIQLATAVQAAAGTALGSTGASLVPPNSLFNATQSATTIIPVTNTSGKLSQLFLDLTQAFTFSTTTTFNANFGRVVATSSVASSFQFASTTALTVSGTASTTNLVLSGTCTKQNGIGCNQITSTTSASTALTSGNSARTTVTAICLSPQLVVGGGGAIVSGTPVAWPDTSYPSANNTWTVIYQNGNTGFGGGGNVQAYAICINP